MNSRDLIDLMLNSCLKAFGLSSMLYFSIAHFNLVRILHTLSTNATKIDDLVKHVLFMCMQKFFFDYYSSLYSLFSATDFFSMIQDGSYSI
jgi:hypothetical protein